MWCRKRHWIDPSVAFGATSPYRGGMKRAPFVRRTPHKLPLKGGCPQDRGFLQKGCNFRPHFRRRTTSGRSRHEAAENQWKRTLSRT